MTVTYDRKRKVYVSDQFTPESSFPTRQEAEAAEIPPDLFNAAFKYSRDIPITIRIARIIMNRKVYRVNKREYTIQASTPDAPGANAVTEDEGYYVTSLYSCTCRSYTSRNRQCCKHMLAMRVMIQDYLVACKYIRPTT